jgi:hypothetical protein
VAVADRGSTFDGFGNLGGGDVIGPKGAQADGRHGGAGVQLSLRNRCWIDGGWLDLAFFAHSGSLTTESYR